MTKMLRSCKCGSQDLFLNVGNGYFINCAGCNAKSRAFGSKAELIEWWGMNDDLPDFKKLILNLVNEG